MIEWQKLPKNLILTESDIICFDIEVSSFWIDDSYNVRAYDPYIDDETYNRWAKGSCVYIWMISINNKVYYGREFNEVKECFDYLMECFIPSNEKSMLHIFIHNFSYEIQFLRNLIQFDSVFARAERKPMKATYKKIEFRCTYFLTNLSLASWGKKIGLNKKVGQLAYKVLRTPYTKLTPAELEYCEYDLLVMYAGLIQFVERYGSIAKIPLTSTGEVRRAVTNLYQKDMKHKYQVTNLQPSTVNKYSIYKSVFAGGDCHTLLEHANEEVENAASEDITSDYPFQLISNEYPSKPFRMTMDSEEKWDFKKNAYIFHVQYKGLEARTSFTYLAYSRCKAVENIKNDNGRIFSASFVDLWCTENELPFIRKLYSFKEETFFEVFKSPKKYLDKPFINFILKLYRDKTLLKGAKTKEENDLYMHSKQLLNSLYGLCVQDLVNCEVSLDEEGWSHKRMTSEDLQSTLDDIQSKVWKNNLSYTTGIWCTSYARKELWTMLLEVGSDACYWDTDSCKFIHPEKHLHKFENRNKVLKHKLEKALKYHDIPFEDAAPVKDGKTYIIGQWDFDGIYEKAKFLGAKKYCYLQDGEIHITVSGVPKQAAKCLKSISDFKDGFYFDREVCEKNQSYYLDGDNYEGYLPDGYFLSQPYGLNIRNCGYTLSLTSAYKEMINFLKGGRK